MLPASSSSRSRPPTGSSPPTIPSRMASYAFSAALDIGLYTTVARAGQARPRDVRNVYNPRLPAAAGPATRDEPGQHQRGRDGERRRVAGLGRDHPEAEGAGPDPQVVGEVPDGAHRPEPGRRHPAQHHRHGGDLGDPEPAPEQGHPGQDGRRAVDQDQGRHAGGGGHDPGDEQDRRSVPVAVPPGPPAGAGGRGRLDEQRHRGQPARAPAHRQGQEGHHHPGRHGRHREGGRRPHEGRRAQPGQDADGRPRRGARPGSPGTTTSPARAAAAPAANTAG